MEESHIPEIEAIIPKLSDLVNSNSPDIKYDVGDGTAIGFNLYNNGEIAVQRTFLSKGTIFPEHIHSDSVEIIIIYKGKGRCNINGVSKEFGVGEYCFVDTGLPHSWEILEDTWLIGITIPATEGYPNGK